MVLSHLSIKDAIRPLSKSNLVLKVFFVYLKLWRSSVSKDYIKTSSYQYHKSAGIILSAGLIEFLSDPALFLANARRQLKESGAMVILGPRKNLFGQIYRFYHLSHGISVRLFGHEELEELARDAGWRIRKSEIIPPFAQALRMEPVTWLNVHYS